MCISCLQIIWDYSYISYQMLIFWHILAPFFQVHNGCPGPSDEGSRSAKGQGLAHLKWQTWVWRRHLRIHYPPLLWEPASVDVGTPTRDKHFHATPSLNLKLPLHTSQCSTVSDNHVDSENPNLPPSSIGSRAWRLIQVVGMCVSMYFICKWKISGFPDVFIVWPSYAQVDQQCPMLWDFLSPMLQRNHG